MRVELKGKQRKATEREIAELREAHGEEALRSVGDAAAERARLHAELAANERQLLSEWDHATAWLTNYAFIDSDSALLSARGRACAAFADGQPLIIGTIISDGWLAELSLADVCAWVCLFLENRAMPDFTADDLDPKPPKPSAALEQAPPPLPSACGGCVRYQSMPRAGDRRDEGSRSDPRRRA